MFRQRNALGQFFYMILKFLKKSECYRRVHILCGGPIQVVLTIVTGIDNRQRNLDKIKIKKKDLFFIFKF
jgi:hypothetical protein